MSDTLSVLDEPLPDLSGSTLKDAMEAYTEAIRQLRTAAAILMGPSVTGEDAMRLERACNRSIDILCSGAGMSRRG